MKIDVLESGSISFRETKGETNISERKPLARLEARAV